MRGGEGSEVVDLEICAGVGDEREAGGVGFGESVEREGDDGLNDLFLRLGLDAVARHAATEFDLDLLHAFFAERLAPSARRSSSASPPVKSGGDHGDAQQLFLEERHSERAHEDGFERGMRVLDGRASLASLDVRIHHFADDGAGANERHLHDDVVKAFGMQARQAGHLRAAFDLEHADGVGLLQGGVDSGIVGRQVRESKPLRDSGRG